MPGLNWRAIEVAELVREPFEHIALAQVLEPDCAAAIPGEFPAISMPGSFALADAPPGPALGGLIDDLLSDRFRANMARVFRVDLEARPTLVTLRGQCSARDGQVHTDSRSKILSLLIYLNEEWPRREGRLRLMSRQDSSRTAVEIPATMGSMVAFRRTDRSWHGHAPFIGQRRALQLNYMETRRASVVGLFRRRVSALGKQLAAFAQ